VRTQDLIFVLRDLNQRRSQLGLEVGDGIELLETLSLLGLVA
jgi:hypothetical protein